MPFIPFKFKKANALTRLADFDTQPTWGGLASKIAELFDIPRKDIGVAYVDKYKNPITLSNKQDLQRFYKSLDQSSEEIKFVVQDLRAPDGESTFSFVPPPPVYFLPVSYITTRSHSLSRSCVFMTIRTWSVIYHCSISRKYNHINLVNGFQSIKERWAVSGIQANDLLIGLDGDLKLFCWFIGQSDGPFSVKIRGNETVDDLKEAIKKKNEHTLPGIGAHVLNLWKVSESSWYKVDGIWCSRSYRHQFFLLNSV